MAHVTRHLLQVAKVQMGKRHDFIKVKVVHMVFNAKLNKHFNESTELWALDQDNSCQQGDLVLIKELPQEHAVDVRHTVHKVIFPKGTTVDPVTNRRCIGTEYLDDINRTKAFHALEADEFKAQLS